MRAMGQPPKGIRRQRLLAGLRLHDLAEKAGMSATTLSRIERGERTLAEEERRALAVALDVPEAELFEEASDMDRSTEQGR